jgi:hypothetical protein
MFQHWINAESYPVAKLCVNTFQATTVTLIKMGFNSVGLGLRQKKREGVKVVSPTHRPPLTPSPRNYSWYSFLLEPESTPSHSEAGNIRSMKNSSDTIGNWTRDFPACGTVPQPTAPPRLWEGECEISRTRDFHQHIYMTIITVSRSTRWRSGWGTALETGRSQDRLLSMVSLEFFIDIILPAALRPWGRLILRAIANASR